MVFPLAIAGLFASHALRLGITSGGLRTGVSQFASSLPFGAGYSFGTYLGFPKNYTRKSYKRLVSTNNMPFGRGYGRYQSRRYSRYPSRRYNSYMPRRRYRSYRPRRRYY